MGESSQSRNKLAPTTNSPPPTLLSVGESSSEKFGLPNGNPLLSFNLKPATVVTPHIYSQNRNLSSLGTSFERPKSIVELLQARAQNSWLSLKSNDIDEFFTRVYKYYAAKGLLSLIVAGIVPLLTSAFLVSFSTFLFACVDHSKIKDAETLSDVLVPRCLAKLPAFPAVLLLSYCSWWTFQLARLIFSIPSLLETHLFYRFLLGVSDSELGCVSWPQVANEILLLQTHGPKNRANDKLGGEDRTQLPEKFCCPALKRHVLNPHYIVNRIMRRDNYLIALMNQKLLNFGFPRPLTILGLDRRMVDRAKSRFDSSDELNEDAPLLSSKASGAHDCRKRDESLFTQCLEFNLKLALLPFLFDSQNGQIKTQIMDTSQHAILAKNLKTRFKIIGWIHLIFSPIVFLVLVTYLFFKHARALQTNPEMMLRRTLTPLACWKFREYNELTHFWKQRVNRSLPLARLYLNQTSCGKVTASMCKFLALVSGSLASTLALLVLFDKDFKLDLQVTPSRTVVYYLTLFGSLFALSYKGIPNSERIHYDLGDLSTRWTEETHYDFYQADLDPVKSSHATQRGLESFYQHRFYLLLKELISVWLVPFIFIWSLPECSHSILQFVRFHTLPIDGLGLVCSLAAFDFGKHPPAFAPQINPLKAENDGSGSDILFANGDSRARGIPKMEASFLNFQLNYGNQWVPPVGRQPEAIDFMSKLHHFIQQSTPKPMLSPLDAPLEKPNVGTLQQLNAPLSDLFQTTEQPFPYNTQSKNFRDKAMEESLTDDTSGYLSLRGAADEKPLRLTTELPFTTYKPTNSVPVSRGIFSVLAQLYRYGV